MAVNPWGPNAWHITHPGFEENPGEYLHEPYRMSYEFATFITDWALGKTGRTSFHMRNFLIAQRKSCYHKPLMNNMGILTDDGKIVLERARLYIEWIKRYYMSIGVSESNVPTWEQADTMDTVVLAGMFESRSMVFLRTLYNKIFPIDPADHLAAAHLGLELPTDLDFEFREHLGTTYMMTGPLRGIPHRRVAFEILVKFGLVDLQSLPKSFDQKGKGRAPVGAALTTSGRKFYEDYLERFDPTRIENRERERRLNEIRYGR